MALSADDIDRNDCLAMIRRTGRLELELRHLLSGCCMVTEQYEAGRGTVYYWSGKPDSGRRAR